MLGMWQRGGCQETGRSSPGGPSGPRWLPGPGRIAWNAAGGRPRLPDRRKRCGAWAVGGRGEEAILRPAAVLGVWPDGSDGTDINSLCRSHNERVVAVADDFCKVHLFQYPCARAKVRPPGASGAWRAGAGSRAPRPPQLGLLSRPGSEPRVRRPRQPRDQRPVHARRLAPHLAGRQGRQHLPVASAGRWGRGAGARHALSNPLPVPRLLSRCLTAAGGEPPALRRGPAHPKPPGPGADFSSTSRHSRSRVSLEGANGTPHTL